MGAGSKGSIAVAGTITVAVGVATGTLLAARALFRAWGKTTLFGASIFRRAIELPKRIMRKVIFVGTFSMILPYIGYRTYAGLIGLKKNQRGLGGERDDQDVRDIRPG